MIDVKDVLDILAIDLIGVIPDDTAVVVSTNKGEPLTLGDESIAARAFSNVARRILGEEVPLLDLDASDQKGFFGFLRKALGL
jgi:Septum formation inhibitor-activating ATPase